MLHIVINLIFMLAIFAVIDFMKKKKHGFNWKGEKVRNCVVETDETGFCPKCRDKS